MATSKAVVFCGDDHAEFRGIKCRRIMQKHDECLGTKSSNTKQDDDAWAFATGKVMYQCCSETPKDTTTTSLADHQVQDSDVNCCNMVATETHHDSSDCDSEDDSRANDREFDGAHGGEDARLPVPTVIDDALPANHSGHHHGHDGSDGSGGGKGGGSGSDGDPSSDESDSGDSYVPRTLPCQIKVDTMVTAVFDHDFECKSRWTDTWNGAVAVANPAAFTNTWLGFNAMAP